MFNRLTIHSNTYLGFTLEETLKEARATDFTKIEWAVVEYMWHVLATMSGIEFSQVQALINEYSMDSEE